jgi:alanine-synthesizing transaminase
VFSRRTDWDLSLTPFARAVERHRASGRDLLDLSESNPTRVGLGYEVPQILGALSDRRSLEYAPDPKGLIAARKAVAAYYAERLPPGSEVSTDSIFLTTSTSEAYSFIFRLLCNAGDEILVPAPSYPLFEFLADLNDVRLCRYPLLYDHGWHIDLHSLTRVITSQTRAVLLVNPNNPTGSCVRSEDLAQLNQLCAAQALALVSDEVFLDYNHHGQPAPLTLAANRDVLTFTLSGISKICALPQMKFAWAVVSGPPSQVQPARERLEVISDTFLSMNSPIQWAAPVLLAQRRPIRDQLLARIHQNLAELDRQLADQDLCTRMQIEAGWYAVLRVPATRSDEELAIHLLQECSVLIHPGRFYGFPSDGFLVLSLIPYAAGFNDALRRVLHQVSTYSR